jgi:tetratricopeptide (TPR) repeat protein
LWESDWEGAEVAYLQGTELHPDDPLAYAHLAYLHIQRPQTRPQAVAEAQKAAELAPDNPEMLAFLVKALDFNARFAEALEEAEKALELAPDDPLVLAVLAEVYLDTNQYDKALTTAQQAVETDPDLLEARRSLAAVYASIGEVDMAKDEIHAAYLLHSHFAPIVVYKGSYYGLDGEDSNREYYLKEALSYDPEYIPALSSLAAHYRDQETYDKALELCDQIVALESELPDGYICRGELYLVRDVLDDALKNFDLAIDRDVESPGGYSGRGRVFLEQNDCGAAQGEFEKVAELRPFSGQARTYTGFTELCKKEHAAAIESFQEAMAMDPYSAAPLFGLGLAYLGEERYEDAEAQLLAAIEISDDIAIYHLRLGDALAELEKYEQAEDAYLHAIELEPEEIDPYLALGNFLLDRERYHEAEEQFDRALALNEESIPALVGLGFTYAVQERCCEATNVLGQARDLDPDNFVADEVYNQCWEVCRRENPPGPQGDPVDEATAVALAQNAVASSLGLSGDNVVAQFHTSDDGVRVLVVGYLATFDPNAQPTEFTNQLNQAIFASVDAFVRADPAPLFLSVEAYAIQGGDVALLSSRVIHRVDAIDWWKGQVSDAAFIGKWYTP